MELDLFGPSPDRAAGAGRAAPLALRMRPRSIEEVVGQEDLLGPGRVLPRLLEGGQLPSLLFWGPPGSGKTTLALLLARTVGADFVPLSAVAAGVKEIREAVERSRGNLRRDGRRTVLFLDEIHRFNKAQQDALLPHVEDGTLILLGATTENPSFEVNAALLSRMRVLVLKPLGEADLGSLAGRALADGERGLGAARHAISEDGRALLIASSDGDARRLFNTLEVAAGLVPEGGEIDVATVREALQRSHLRYDRVGEEHYNIISALHKSIRDSDPDASLYWLARMLVAGEDRLYLARRLVRAAVEDVGLADPGALRLAMAARDAVHFLGEPEGDLALAELAVYLALAPKSNSIYKAYGEAVGDAEKFGSLPVPAHLRNAVTGLMAKLGYGAGYRHAHDFEGHTVAQVHLPDPLQGRRYYEPGGEGGERTLRERLEALRAAWEKDRKKGA